MAIDFPNSPSTNQVYSAAEAAIAAKESAKAKLSALGLTEEEVNAIIGSI